MTELFVTKAIVKLPRKSNNNRLSTLLVDTTNAMSSRQYSNSSSNNNYKDYLVTDKLYFEGLSTVVTENEIMDLVRSCDPIKIHLNRNGNNTNDGYIQFMNREMADRAYTLLNCATTRATGTRLQLKINPPGGDSPEPEAHADILHIKNLPSHMDNNKALYELFRPFGPMTLCKILVEQQGFRGTALVQYFFSENAQDAENSMNNKPVQDNIITVIPFVSSKSSKTPPSSSSQTIETSSTTEDLVRSNHRYSNTTTISTPTSPLPPPQMNNTSTPPPVRSDGSSMVDYTNLYIKNLDLNVKSADLFNHFRKFGRIISARVMKNAQTKQSKGFGFVSFSKADEAQKAKQDMNGEYILSKPVIVAFHEPKKPRDTPATPVTTNGYSPTEFTTYGQQRSSPPPPPIPSQPTLNFIDHGYYHHNQQQANTNVKGTRDFIDYRYNNNNNIPVVTTVQQQQQQQKYISPPPPPQDHPYPVMSTKTNYQIGMERNNSRQSHHSNNNYYDHRQIHIPSHTTPLKRDLSSSGSQQQPSLSALASGAFINTPPPLYYGQTPSPQQQQRPTFRRRGSVESVATVMTETTSKTRRQTITKAVLSTIDKSDEPLLYDIVDMLLTLKKKDLATCLFNNVFLKAKIKQAKDALDIFEEQQRQLEEDDEEEEEVIVAVAEQPTKYVTIPPRSSRAIPIVAPPPTTNNNSQKSQIQSKSIDPLTSSDKTLNEEIQKFLASLKGLEVHEQKQLLGDRLFPLVKSTGVKGAPRITILLLDSVPLDQLAYSMYDKDKLKQQVNQVLATITSN